MSEARRNMLIGLFMVGGLGALGFLMVVFGEAPSWLGGAEWDLKINVKEIAGVDEGTPIYLNGIKIGRVVALDFVNSSEPEKGVEIVGRIKNQFSVPRGARAVCMGPAMGLGRGSVEIFAEGAGMEPLPPGGRIVGISKNPLEDIIPESLVSSFEGTVIRIGNFAETLTPVADDLHQILRIRTVAEVDSQQSAAQVTANLYTAIERLDTALKNINAIVGDAELRQGLLQAVKDLRTMTEDGKTAFADLSRHDCQSQDRTLRALRIAWRRQSTTSTGASHRSPTRPCRSSTTRRERLPISKSFRRGLLTGAARSDACLTDERLHEALLLTIERFRDFIDSMRRLTDRFEQKGRISLDVGGIPVDKPIPQN